MERHLDIVPLCLDERVVQLAERGADAFGRLAGRGVNGSRAAVEPNVEAAERG